MTRVDTDDTDDQVSPHTSGEPGPGPVVSLNSVTVSRGGRTLIRDLDLEVAAGEFVAVLGPNGAGKTTLLKVLLGELAPDSGTVLVDGRVPGDRGTHLGYVPQQKAFDPGITLRGRDLVGLGIDGTRWGPGWPTGRGEKRRVVADSLDRLGAGRLADKPLGRMSGGEQQRVRVAQAIACDPCVMLCDEPLLSLDLAGQRTVAAVLDHRRREHGTAVIFVTHEINPVLPMVDRIVYLVGGRHRIGTPEEVFTTDVMSDLYSSPVEVLRVRGQIIVVGDTQHLVAEPWSTGHHHHDDAHPGHGA
ncbi:ABC transporter ATP-binding protein [Dietzia natronolimnaea]|uniref:ABC transporter ATP-binding protein n=1 Tax=Dietzia natronolimnaea TaxID=161920 RepID=A0A2A2WM09_9ACTN|nr:metal ABC transporter ATP-binding protein [Dietzia natronolimnaea]PAY22246.1 ABC transporter ATP-binding protein [Dietzia natronolimnaea]